MIIETSANQTFRVRETDDPNLAHGEGPRDTGPQGRLPRSAVMNYAADICPLTPPARTPVVTEPEAPEPVF